MFNQNHFQIWVGVILLLSGNVAWAQNREKPTSPKGNQPAAANKPTPQVDAAAKNPAKGNAGQFESTDHESINQSAQAFAEYYCAHDAKRLASLFSPQAELINEEGNITKGQAAIEKTFASVFQSAPQSTIQIEVQSIRIVTPNLAIEEGVTRSKEQPDDDEEVTSYLAIHSKVDGRWLISSIRDFGTPTAVLTAHDRLQELAWLVGEWVEESPEAVIRSKYQWHDNENFIMQEFHVQIMGRTAMSGTMRLGWDAVRKQFKSWVFDSLGGHAEGYWLRDGDQWIVKSQGATASGQAASATFIYKLVDNETILWSSIDRIVDGERVSDIEPITIKRRPPAPAE